MIKAGTTYLQQWMPPPLFDEAAAFHVEVSFAFFPSLSFALTSLGFRPSAFVAEAVFFFCPLLVLFLDFQLSFWPCFLLVSLDLVFFFVPRDLPRLYFHRCISLWYKNVIKQLPFWDYWESGEVKGRGKERKKGKVKEWDGSIFFLSRKSENLVRIRYRKDKG